MEERDSMYAFGTQEEQIPFLWNIVGRYSFHTNPNIHYDLWFSFPLFDARDGAYK
jgi:hypothetical protein